MKASEYFDRIIVAEKPVEVFRGSPGGSVFKTIAQGREIGRIYSYVEGPDGLYWQLYTDDSANDLFVKHNMDSLELRAGGISAGNLLKEFTDFIGFGSVAEGGLNVLRLAVVGLVAYTAIKAFNFFD